MLHKLGIRENGDNLWLSLKRRLPPPSAWLWATLWSAVFTALFLRTLYSEKCFAVTHGPEYLWPVGLFVWFWLYLFFLLSNRGRVVLLVCWVLVWAALPHVTTIQGAAAEIRTIGELRTLAAAVEASRTEHPQEGYPATLPKMPSESVRRYCKIEYKTSRSKPGGPIDGFLIEITPVWRVCTFRSFTAAEDGQIHSTFEYRPATKADPAIQ